jgi:mannose-6-phosphate isomerase-like protein (cupin superfamily)
MHLKDERGEARVVTLGEGELYIVPRGVEHKPEARGGDAHMLLFEPKSTRSTGQVEHAHTLEPEELASLEDLPRS